METRVLVVFFISVCFGFRHGCIAQADLEFTVEFWLASDWVLLPQPPKSWDYGHTTGQLFLLLDDQTNFLSLAVGSAASPSHCSWMDMGSACSQNRPSSHALSPPARPSLAYPLAAEGALIIAVGPPG